MEVNSQKKIKCLCCDGGAEFFVNKNNHDLFRCSRCGFLFIWPLPNIASIYTANYFMGAKDGFGYADYDQDKKATESTFFSFLNTIEQYKVDKGKALDVGAATGFFVSLANKKGWQAEGLEISDWAASLARRRRLNIATGTLENHNFQEQSFDLITMWDVLEHVPNPKLALEESHKLLKRGGLLAINTPDAGSLVAKIMGKKWHLLVPPEHLYYFNEKNLCQLCEKIGFKVLRKERPAKRFTIQYTFKFLANKLRSRILANIADQISNSGLGKIGLPLNLRDNIFIVLKKV